MSDAKDTGRETGASVGRRTFLKLATAGAAAAAVQSSSAGEDRMSEKEDRGLRGPAAFAYGYNRDPYPLEPGPHLFIDWRYVMAGWTNYAVEGRGAELFPGQGRVPEKVTFDPHWVPTGVRLVAERAHKIGPVMKNDRDWEFMISGYASLHDLGGKFGLWYETVPPGGNGDSNLICYAESKDGREWVKPELGLVEFGGSKRNNIVIDGSRTPYGGLHGQSVFVDPAAPPGERFKIIFMSYLSGGPEEAVLQRLRQERPHSVDDFGQALRAGILLGRSPDGLRWSFSDRILFSHVCDSQTCVYHDDFLDRWVLYTRTSALGRRCIGRAETSDIDDWPVPETILWENDPSEPHIDLYCNSKSLYPGTRTMHLMFPTLYLRSTDSCSLALSSSPDGIVWTRVPGQVLECGPEGSWDAGCLFGGFGLTELPGDIVVLPYGGYRHPHKYPRYERLGQVGFAAWKKERLSAIQADGFGEFVTIALTPPGDRLYLNFEAKMPGYIRVAVEGVENRGLRDCDVLTGDQLKQLVTWKGDPSLGVPRGTWLRLRIQMKSAKLYSFEFK